MVVIRVFIGWFLGNMKVCFLVLILGKFVLFINLIVIVVEFVFGNELSFFICIENVIFEVSFSGLVVIIVFFSGLM